MQSSPFILAYAAPGRWWNQLTCWRMVALLGPGVLTLGCFALILYYDLEEPHLGTPEPWPVRLVFSALPVALMGAWLLWALLAAGLVWTWRWAILLLILGVPLAMVSIDGVHHVRVRFLQDQAVVAGWYQLMEKEAGRRPKDQPRAAADLPVRYLEDIH